MTARSFFGFLRGILLLSLAWLPVQAQATESDVGKEQRWAEQVIDSLLDGDELWLDDGAGHEFLGILTEGNDAAQAVILVHGIGVHPNWPDVIYPLRESLLEAGITSLSIQMPILANDAESAEYLPLFAEVPNRLNAAIDHLREAGYSRISLVAHSMGASMTAHAMSRPGMSKVSSVVLIGMGPGIDGKANIEAMGKIGVPLFDLSGSEDLPQVLESAEFRAEAGRSRQDLEFRQVVVDGANHFFQGHEEALVRNTLDWLGRH